MIRKVLAVVLVGALISSAVPVAAQTVEPELRTYVASPTLTPGQVNEVQVQLVNDASDFDDTASTAKNININPKDTGRLDVQTGSLFLPSLADPNAAQQGSAASREITLAVKVPSDIEAGTYRIPIDVEYEWDSENGPNERSTTEYATVRVEEGPRFAVVDTNSTATVGGSGTFEVTMENVGEQAARDSTLTLSSQSGDVAISGGQQGNRYVDRWETGERRTFEFDTSLTNTARPGNYTLNALVSYKDANGNDGRSPNISVGMNALPEQTFDIGGVNSSLRVGEEGTLTAEVTNNGPQPARNAVVVIDQPGQTVTPIETEYAVGDLAPGESASFSFDVEVSSEATSGPRQLGMSVKYRGDNGKQRQSDTIDVRAEVAPQADEFDVEPVNSTFAAGDGGTLELTVTNTRNETLTDISAKIYPESPLSSSNSEAFIEELGPGESETIRFQTSAGGDAMPKTYPMKLDFQYDDADGDTLISDTYQVPVRVTESEGGGLPFVVVGVALALLGAGGALIYRRRD
ncbi:COG1361 S-layer family protein [Halopelagius longus]|uniref:Conserved repeat domain-containing protein n=1 Tax=Halopelagius longus TaxID=1236180 RepID=A0A1H1AY56_9EURY|nr:COG1361 S-layer family protein [Halopelagius longus]RDI72979.1 DUF11 domain-containing protein [Halopelagius longus]SDQ44635.1 conserved repeat domain-containing protein [Halopelagius longus]